ncbi:hypothetical protein CVT24_012630 [Panaeolus cyanescens]|uniref:ER membrane protein complex subunit 7 beta-sandwich domain-containing protein n=1 Tax=Panaeolus cyanescens TaxID=181874 RepID=A0A409WD37_9AGAR|nr:hypothetical protein CVT24_012630 [Panaeolus cyanescens]
MFDSELGQSKASLDNGFITGSIKQDGSFQLSSVPDGTYILSIISHDYIFDQVLITVNDTSTIPDVRPYIPGTPTKPPSSVNLFYPVVFIPRGKNNYYVPLEKFNLATMLSNPMMLLMIGGAGMMLGMPYLIKNLDPEALEELKEQQGKMSGIQQAFQSGDIKSGLSAIMAAADDTNQTPSSRAATPGKGKGAADKEVLQQDVTMGRMMENGVKNGALIMDSLDYEHAIIPTKTNIFFNCGSRSFLNFEACN